MTVFSWRASSGVRKDLAFWDGVLEPSEALTGGGLMPKVRRVFGEWISLEDKCVN